MSESVRTRVRRGARLLDEKRPGWENSFGRRPKLDLLDPCGCVLGRVFAAEAKRVGRPSGFGVGCTFLRTPSSYDGEVGWLTRRGFLVGKNDIVLDLEIAWHEEIKARKVRA